VDEKSKLFTFLEENRDKMVELQSLLTAIPAISPDSGGDGEWKKGLALTDWLKKEGFTDITFYNAPDNRATNGKRPNIVATVPGKKDDLAVWIMTHLDVVPPGKEEMWDSDPYTVVEKDGKLFGRGVEDNQQGLVSSVFAALAYLKTGLVPDYTIKLLFIADEETGSDYGIKYLLKEENLFGDNDSVLVPDGGRADGTMVEIAEKSVLWLEFTVEGKQCHASRPDHGINAFVAGSDLVLALHDLQNHFSRQNTLFEPPYSTFSPTRKNGNVPNINTIPGEDVFCLDSRIIPDIPVDDVLEEIDNRCSRIEKKWGVSVGYEVKQRVSSIATPSDAELVQSLQKRVEEVYRVEPELVGIGGGTVGAYLRNVHIPTVVWAKLEDTAHNPNEYCVIDNMVGDAKVMALLMLEPNDRKA
jgi:succinyl-diaminopimelate desuccinylase